MMMVTEEMRALSSLATASKYGRVTAQEYDKGLMMGYPSGRGYTCYTLLGNKEMCKYAWFFLGSQGIISFLFTGC